MRIFNFLTVHSAIIPLIKFAFLGVKIENLKAVELGRRGQLGY